MDLGFLGSYEHTIDEKERVNIPAKFKRDIENLSAPENRNTLILTAAQTSDGKKYIEIFPVEKWQKVAAEFEDKEIKDYWNLSQEKINDNKIREKMIYTFPVNMDKSGRIIIPSKLKKYAGIEKEVVFIGRKYKIELWDKRKLDEQNL